MINKDSLKDEPLGSLVDRAWNCGCGALNSAYNKECGECNTIKPTGNWEQIIKK